MPPRPRSGARREASADAGLCRESNLEALAGRKIRGDLAPGRAAHAAPDPSGCRRTKPGARMAKMAARLKRAGRRLRYRLRQQTVEPVIGQIKQARGFRQFLLRGCAKVAAEWALVGTAHNLTKLLAARAA
jgi:Transposase DDE domain